MESLSRMDRAAGEEDVVFRIGGDEFCMLTDSEDPAYAKAIADKILACNGETFDYEGRQIPLSLHVVVTSFNGDVVRYNELFEQLHTAIKVGKE